MADLPVPGAAGPDLLLVSRYALLVSLTLLIPVPIVDALVDSALRRRLTRLQLRAAGIEDLEKRDVALLGDASAGGCVGLVWSVITWPFKRLLRYLLWVLLVKAMVDTFSDVVARAVLVQAALDAGALPGDAVHLRAAMQRASKGVDTRPLERAVAVIFEASRGEVRRLWRAARPRARDEARRERGDQAPEPADGAPLEGALERLSQALARAVWLPEVHDALREQLAVELRRAPPGGAS